MTSNCHRSTPARSFWRSTFSRWASANIGYQLAAIWRSHWTIENKIHYVRDVTFGEDACHVRTGTAPHALAAFRNAVISLFRLKRWPSVPDAIEYYSASLDRTLNLIGLPGFS